MVDTYELAIDTEDSYRETPDIFYMHPCRIQVLRAVENNSFGGCVIKNTPVANLTSLNFVTILEKIKPKANVEIYVDQPITVMQDYDAKEIEANANLAGFEDITTKKGTYTKESTGKKIETLVVTLTKPEKSNKIIEAEVSVPATTSKSTFSTSTNKRKK